MDTIPTINIVAVFHLFSVAFLFGLLSVEAVIEYYPLFFKKNDPVMHHHSIIFHKWIDLFVELPALIFVLGTGIVMAFLVDELTILHIVKIICSSAAGITFFFCIRNVLKRHSLLSNKAPEDVLKSKTRQIMIKLVSFLMLFIFSALIIGCWLAYHRVLKSIYGS